MNRLRCFSRYRPLPSLLLLVASMLPQGVAAEVPLRAFTADYDLFRNGMHIAVSKLSLRRSAGSWRWIMETKSRGIYSWFIDSSPYTETAFTQNGDTLRLQEIVIADAGDKKKYESAKFDWDEKELRVLRRGKQKSMELGEDVYDYQSIHVLAAAMQIRRQNSATVDFYRKGNLVRSHITFKGEGKVAIDGKNIGANIYDQAITKSDSRLRYYYDAENPLLPLRIEKLGSDDGPTVLSLKRVEWKL